MYRVSIFCLLIMFLFLSTPTHAQKSLSIPDALENAVKEKEPKWTLNSFMIRKNQEENYTYFRWRRGKQEIGVHVNEYAENIKISETSLLTAAFRERIPLKDIGDEAYLIMNNPNYKPDMYAVVFRKGKVRVSIEADEEDIARRFARHLADALPPSGN